MLENVTNLTLGEAMNEYISFRSKILSPSTVREYSSSRNRYFKNLMNMPVIKITQFDIQKAVNLESLGHSPKTVHNIHGLLSAVLKVYVPDLKLNTALPQKRKVFYHIPSDGDIVKLIQNSKKNSDLQVAIFLSAYMGLRRSEICALTWKDVINNQLTVNKALVISLSGKLVKKGTKTFHSNRILPIPDIVLEYLSGFPKKTNMIINLSPSQITYRFGKLRDESGLKCRFHDLRHYYASVLLSLNVPDKYAMEMMGHSTTNILKNVYQHTFEATKNTLTVRVNKYFSQKHLN